jgi:hypothetical protein
MATAVWKRVRAWAGGLGTLRRMAARVCSFHSRAAEGAAEAGKGLRERRAMVPRGRRRREIMARGAWCRDWGDDSVEVVWKP